MALKALMLKKRLDDKKKLLAALREDAEKLKTREAELEQAITEAETDEEKQTVEDAVTAFENDKAENEKQVSALEQEIADTERELAEAEQKANRGAAPAPQTSAPEATERKGEFNYSGTVGMWQRSSKGSVPGISGDVDLDTAYIDYHTKIKAKGLNGFVKTGTRQMCLELIECVTIDRYVDMKTQRDIHIYYKLIDKPLRYKTNALA